MIEKGIASTVLKVSGQTEADRLQLAEEFTRFGSKAILLTGSQRGGDFLMNQLFGQWAERTVVSMDIEGLVLRPFGPSSAAMPGQQDHRELVMTYRQIQLLEGKRPDLIAFDADVWSSLSAEAISRVEQWPDRLLQPPDRDILRQARFGAEVKISKWHYGRRRAAGLGPLSVTIKDEERADISNWERRTQLPVLFFQALLDEVYCMSFARMESSIKQGYLYEPGDVISGTEQGAGGKSWHRIHVDGPPHLLGSAEFPEHSAGEVPGIGERCGRRIRQLRPCIRDVLEARCRIRRTRFRGSSPSWRVRAARDHPIRDP